MIFSPERCEISLGGGAYPVCDLNVRLEDEPSATRPVMPHEFTIEFAADVEDGPLLDIAAFIKPAKADLLFNGPWFGGTLRTLMGEVTSTWRGEQSIDFDGRVRRFEWERDGARVAWDPAAVNVYPCFVVGLDPTESAVSA